MPGEEWRLINKRFRLSIAACDQEADGAVIAEMGFAVDTVGDPLTGGDSAIGNVDCSEQILVPVAGTNRVGQGRRFRGNGLQAERIVFMHEEQDGRRMEQDAEAVGDSFHHSRGVGQAVKSSGEIGENQSASTFFL